MIRNPIDKSTSPQALYRTFFNNPNQARLWGIEIEASQEPRLPRRRFRAVLLDRRQLHVHRREGRPHRRRAAALDAFFGVTPGTIEIHQGLSKSRRLFGQPEWIANADLSFDQPDWGTKATLAFFAISDVLDAAGVANLNSDNKVFSLTLDRYIDSYSRLDLIVSQSLHTGFFGGDLIFKISAKNLTDTTRRIVYDPGQTSSATPSARTSSAGTSSSRSRSSTEALPAQTSRRSDDVTGSSRVGNPAPPPCGAHQPEDSQPMFRRIFAIGRWPSESPSAARARPGRRSSSTDITTNTTWGSGQPSPIILQQPIFVKNGATLTILPGTIIRGQPRQAAGRGGLDGRRARRADRDPDRPHHRGPARATQPDHLDDRGDRQQQRRHRGRLRAPTASRTSGPPATPSSTTPEDRAARSAQRGGQRQRAALGRPRHPRQRADQPRRQGGVGFGKCTSKA